MIRRAVALIFAASGVAASGARAQDYRVRIDGSAQAISFRGLQADSIAATLVVPAPSGGPQTPDGYAVRCAGGAAYCYYFRPGDIQRSVPATTTVHVTMWGFGVTGLSARASGRVLGDLGGSQAWPGVQPAAQLIEGFLEYQQSLMIARAGRQLLTSRLEQLGFDGASLRGHWNDYGLDLGAYAGWGLGQAAALPVGSPALNPLDEWRPNERQILAGVEAGWLHRYADIRGEYRREIDPLDDNVVSERASLSAVSQFRSLRATGGADVNLAEGHLGSADVALSFLQPRYAVTAGARRYRPYFSLWTLWGAFSPVPYHAVHSSGEWRVTRALSINARAEWYRYEDADVSTGLVPQLQDHGWRASTGARMTLGSAWSADATAGMEHGPGAAGEFADLSIGFRPDERVSLALYGGALARPLELRYYDARSRWIGGRGELQLTTQRRLWADVAFIGDDRERPDAAATSMEQVRVRAGFNLAFGSGADRTPLPPARRAPR